MIVSEAENGEMLIAEVQKHMPDIVITDIKMPVLDGIEACKTITDQFPHIGVIALSTFDNDDLVIDMLDAGAKGYLLKNTDKAELIKAITTVHDGGTYFCDHITSGFHKMLTQSRKSHYNQRSKVEFSSKERSIIELSSRELTNKEIASALNLSVRTVESHKLRMQTKIEAKNMIGVIIYAIKHNLINVESI